MKFKMQPMRCKMFKMTLRKKIVVFIIFVAIYPMILLGILGYYNYEKIIKERFVAYSQNDMNQLVKTMDSEMLDMSENVRQILADNELQSILKERQNVLSVFLFPLSFLCYFLLFSFIDITSS